MSRVCAKIFWGYEIIGAVALALVPASHYGLFGLEPDPLSGVFAVILGQPWLSLLPFDLGTGGVLLNVLIVGVCILVNASILYLLCRLIRRG